MMFKVFISYSAIVAISYANGSIFLVKKKTTTFPAPTPVISWTTQWDSRRTVDIWTSLLVAHRHPICRVTGHWLERDNHAELILQTFRLCMQLHIPPPSPLSSSSSSPSFCPQSRRQSVQNSSNVMTAMQSTLTNRAFTWGHPAFNFLRAWVW